jgi:hypothetical protein
MNWYVSLRNVARQYHMFMIHKLNNAIESAELKEVMYLMEINYRKYRLIINFWWSAASVLLHYGLVVHKMEM